MNFFCIFAAIGMLAIAGLCGVVLGWLEKKRGRSGWMTRLKELTGQRFGRLVVVGRVEDWKSPSNPKIKRTRWLCRCDCGKLTQVMSYSLTRGWTRSCGCLKADLARERAKNGVLWKGRKHEQTD